MFLLVRYEFAKNERSRNSDIGCISANKMEYLVNRKKGEVLKHKKLLDLICLLLDLGKLIEFSFKIPTLRGSLVQNKIK